MNGFIFMNIGMIILEIGTTIYMSCELGCGSKDAVTMVLTKKLNKPIKLTRSCLEIVAASIGILIGGEFSIITIYSVLLFGYFMEIAFKILKCNPEKLNHISIIDILKVSKNSQNILEYEE